MISLMKEAKANYIKFKEANPRVVEMLEELSRVPWQRHIVGSLTSWINAKSNLTSGQKSLVTNLYLDNCVVSDADIRRQVETRKMCFRLMKCRLGRDMVNFVGSVASYTDTRPFTPAQMKAIDKIAHRMKTQLSGIPELGKKDFDGWYQTADVGLDKPNGV